MIKQLGDPAHKGGIYACSWNKEGTRLLTASGDKTAKIFDIETSSVVNDFVMGKEVGDQQLGCLWQNDYLLSVGLNGYINYLDPSRLVSKFDLELDCTTTTLFLSDLPIFFYKIFQIF